jgi:hypothetical protein
MNSTNLIEDLRLLSPPNYGVWLALGIAGVLALGFFVFMRRRLRRADVDAIAPPGPDLWDAALAELERLTSLVNREHSRDYAIQSTGILRRYIEARYALRAPTLATEEFLVKAAESAALPKDHRVSLRQFLELCDLLKFGRYLASTTELGPLHAAAVAFVIASRPSSPSKKILEGSA